MELHYFAIKDQKKDLEEILSVYTEAVELAKSHGKKEGERFDEEFWEVMKKREDVHKLKEVNIEDLTKSKDV